MIKDLILKNRSYRRFYENHNIPYENLEALIELARLSPSSRNQQALKFKIINEKDECTKVFPNLAWAGYLPDWDGPVEGERPSAYIIVLGDSALGKSFDIDLGICSQSILLGAVNLGYGGCMIASVKKERLRRIISLPEGMEILLVIALGSPLEKVVIDDIKNGDVKYWRDKQNVHHVPKRGVNELII